MVEKPYCGSDASAAEIALDEGGRPAAVGDTAAGDGTAGTAGAWVVAAIDGSSPSTLPGLITEVAPPIVGIGPSGGGEETPTAGAGAVGATGGADGLGVAEPLGLDDLLGLGDGLDEVRGGAVTDTVPTEPGSTDIAGLVAALATAVRLTELVDLLAGTLTETCSWYAVGVTSVASGPSAQVAAPFPPGHVPAKTGDRPEGEADSDTVTLGTGPFSAHTDTVNVAVCPLLMLASPRSTLIQSRAGVAVELGLADGDA